MAKQGENEILKLGGGIELSGFGSLDMRNMIVLKKIIGNYMRKFTNHNSGVQGLKLTLKEVGKKEGAEKWELKGNLILTGNTLNAENTDRNIFVAVDGVLKKLEAELSKL